MGTGIRNTITMICCIIATSTFAQAPGSESTYGGGVSVKSIAMGGTSADAAETVHIGPGTHIIEGTWEIYAKRVIVDASASISGSGTVILFSPAAAGGSAGTTLFDGNNAANSIDVNITLQNNNGLALSNIAFPADLVSAGWANNATSSTLYTGRVLNLAVDGADITLGTGVNGDLKLDADATISNYRPERMVITNNSILSHIVKEGFTSAFTFPVGISDGNYTPASISNTATNTIHVSVQDYTGSASYEQTLDPGPNGVPSDGMNRTWHIYGDVASTGSTITLQHNSATNQSGFTESSHFVTQYGPVSPNNSGDFAISFGTSRWQSNTASAGATGTLLTGAPSLAGSSMRSRSYSSLGTASGADQSYFSKSADPFHPLPIDLISFTATAASCSTLLKWVSGTEKNVSAYRIQHSTDGRQYVTLATVAATGNNHEYTFAHVSPEQGTNLYRLEVVRHEAAAEYSAVRKAMLDCSNAISSLIRVYPNPASAMLTVDGLERNCNNNIRVLNLYGQTVLEQNTTAEAASFDLSVLAAGPYLIQVIKEGDVLFNSTITKW